MAILIKSMDMPTECEYCGFCRYYPENGNVWCNAKNRLLKMNWEKPHWTHLDVKRPDWCPLEALPSAQPKLSCDGCKHLGMFENEIEYGYTCPCLRCIRRADDNYEQ